MIWIDEPQNFTKCRGGSGLFGDPSMSAAAEAPDGPRSVVAFVAPGRPPTSNKTVGNHGARAKLEYSRRYIAAGGTKSEEFSYAAVYYFVPGYRPSNDADAGNIHKRVLDGLQGVAYEDDHVVRIVTAGVIDYGPRANGPLRLEEIDLTRVPPSALEELATAIASAKDHFIYVEIGPLRPAMMAFGIGDAG